VIGFDSLWVVHGLSYSGFAGSWDLSKSVGIGVGFPWKGLRSWRRAWQWVFFRSPESGGEHGSGFSMGGLLKEREMCG
jgi:hypothetical protein